MIVYLHKRISDNQVFYVGIGNKKRAYSKSSRNKHWKDFVKKHKYFVDITHNDIIREDACLIEKYLIEFYRQNGKIPLTNKTNGGDGTDTELSLLLNKKRWSDPNQKKALILRNKKRFSDLNERKKISDCNIKRFSDPKEREKISQLNTERFSDPTQRENNRNKMILFWKNMSNEKRQAYIDKMKKPKKK